MSDRKRNVTEMLATAEAQFADLKRTATHNRAILERLKRGDVESWPELREVLAEGRTLEQVIADAERRVEEQEKTVAEGEAELRRLRILHAGNMAPKVGTA